MPTGGFPHDPSIARFTWDPEAAGLKGSAFTADTMNLTGSLTDVSQADGTHVADRYEEITGFSSHGKTVTPEGFRVANGYGLYFHAVDKGIGGPPPNILDFTSQEVELKADPGFHNGDLISTPDGTHFATTDPTGEADDIVLAHGSLVDAMLFLDLTAATLAGDQVGTFVPDIADFFKGGSGLLHDFAFNPASLLTMTDGPGGTQITNFNGFSSTAQFLSDQPGNGNAYAFGHTDNADSAR